jgi:hypothetical protein
VLAFFLNIGAPISGLLMVLVGFSGGWHMGLYCVGVYVVVQGIDGNIVVPLVAKKTDLAPALVLAMQLIMGTLFGILGLALADPMLAMLKVLLEKLAQRSDGRAPAETKAPRDGAQGCSTMIGGSAADRQRHRRDPLWAKGFAHLALVPAAPSARPPLTSELCRPSVVFQRRSGPR